MKLPNHETAMSQHIVHRQGLLKHTDEVLLRLIDLAYESQFERLRRSTGCSKPKGRADPVGSSTILYPARYASLQIVRSCLLASHVQGNPG